jgi:hypothetical protein
MIGLTGYNTGTYYADHFLEEWREFKQIYDDVQDKYAPFFSDFPWIITEFSSSSIGGDKAKWVDNMFEWIQKYKNIKIAVLSYLTLSSLSFNESDHVIFAELYWTPAHVLQAEDRALRIGKQCPVRIDYLFVYEGVDPYVYKKIEKRLGDF